MKSIIDDVIDDNPQAVQDYEDDVDGALQFLAGRVLHELGGRGDLQEIAVKLKERLDE